MEINKVIAGELSLPVTGVTAVLRLLEDGATIPFISRYRKEMTGSLDEVQIFNIQQRSIALVELDKRRETVISTIESAGKLTDELRERIENVTSMTELEDIYAPYKPRRRTRATMAREAGLEPLARMLMSRNSSGRPETMAQRFVKGDVASVEQALAGASDIIAEWVSDSEKARNVVRRLFNKRGRITTSLSKDHADDKHYVDYHNYTGDLSRCPDYRYLAIRRAENEGVIKVSIDIDSNDALERLDSIFVDCISPSSQDIVADAVTDGYKRLLRPSIENETAAAAKERADRGAISVFADNLRQLLMAPPLGHKAVMGLDPGFRTGCKVVCIDESGALIHHDVIYPVPPRNDVQGARHILLSLISRYGIKAIAIGNGTASRETERFVHDALQGLNDAPTVHVVNEAGASVYSASEVARKEFPDEDVTVRGAVSIARRLVDPMAELVKIEPKSIGVGQYQHDVDQTALKTALDRCVESCVNSVGVNLNTASPELLSYVSGIGPALARSIVDYRQQNGAFNERKSLLKVPRLGQKAYTMAAGFLRIPDGRDPLDNTAVHPERYDLVRRMTRDVGCDVAGFIASPELRSKVDIRQYVDDSVGLPTLRDIMDELARPGRDPRGTVRSIDFDDTIRDITDLSAGMILNGVVNNITAFGAFIDLGIHQSGLIHISQLGVNRRVSSPAEALSLGQPVTVKVLDVDIERKRIALTMKGVQQ